MMPFPLCVRARTHHSVTDAQCCCFVSPPLIRYDNSSINTLCPPAFTLFAANHDPIVNSPLEQPHNLRLRQRIEMQIEADDRR
jgi:hypothetical protein